MDRECVKVGMISLGCAKNLVDSEVMLHDVSIRGYKVTPNPDEADIIIINTCGFIESAKQEAINVILEMAEKKKNAACKSLIVTGCLAQRYSAEITDNFPEVDAVIGIGGYDRICDAIEQSLLKKKYLYNELSYGLEYLNSGRLLSASGGFAYLKISEGCDNRCAYCAIPSIRGPFRSRKPEDIIAEAERLAASGVRELVVVAQDTTRYGKDLYGEPALWELIEKLNDVNGIEWIRIMYLYPDEITERLISAMKNCRKVLHYIDLPLQHINDSILRAMNRRGNGDCIRSVIKRFREEIPDCIIRTSLITGFPGETETEYTELKKFLIDYRLDRVGVFMYSSEEGTPACRLKGKVSKKIKRRRFDELMLLQQKISLENNLNRVGKVYDTLVENVADDGIFYVGRTYAEAPDTDGKLYFTSDVPLYPGDIVPVKILIAEEYDLTGEKV